MRPLHRLSCLGLACVAAFWSGAQAAQLDASLHGAELAVGKKNTKVKDDADAKKLAAWLKDAGAESWAKDAAPELVLSLDEKANWGALQRVLLAAHAAGIARARVKAGDDAEVNLALPGADAGDGEIAELPLSLGKGEGGKDQLIAEANGEKFPCNAELLKGMVQQVGAATIEVKADAKLPARGVVRVLRILTAETKAPSVAYLPAKDLCKLADEKAQEAAKDPNAEGEAGSSHARGMAHSLSQ